ncbi:hypothetical protein BDU57DRAFT_350864 [Ampelomyces quisqualis]|uniref:Uncharacterized protein n=1 Tax=Ampelomyces quisqualis TaxID=50730 RepID=A0A6A5QCG6_AMPQU|nr:hypothetical protein BDU57DRAFT_350864 [Ampelomyces quisqualis]
MRAALCWIWHGAGSLREGRLGSHLTAASRWRPRDSCPASRGPPYRSSVCTVIAHETCPARGLPFGTWIMDDASAGMLDRRAGAEPRWRAQTSRLGRTGGVWTTLHQAAPAEQSRPPARLPSTIKAALWRGVLTCIHSRHHTDRNTRRCAESHYLRSTAALEARRVGRGTAKRQGGGSIAWTGRSRPDKVLCTLESCSSAAISSQAPGSPPCPVRVSWSCGVARR